MAPSFLTLPSGPVHKKGPGHNCHILTHTSICEGQSTFAALFSFLLFLLFLLPLPLPSSSLTRPPHKDHGSIGKAGYCRGNNPNIGRTSLCGLWLGHLPLRSDLLFRVSPIRPWAAFTIKCYIYTSK